MAKYLRVEPGSDPATGHVRGSDYELPADTDIEELVDQVGRAIAQGTSLLVPLARMYGQPADAAYVVINGARVGQVVVGEIPDSSPAPARLSPPMAPPGTAIGSKRQRAGG